MLVSILTLSSHVCNEEDDGKHEAEATDDDVADGEEEVLSTKDICGRKDEEFASLERTHIEVIVDFESVFSSC